MAVLRHLIARLSAETSDFQAGMKAAKGSMDSVNRGASSLAKSLANEIKGMSASQREAALYAASLQGVSAKNIQAAREVADATAAFEKQTAALKQLSAAQKFLQNVANVNAAREMDENRRKLAVHSEIGFLRRQAEMARQAGEARRVASLQSAFAMQAHERQARSLTATLEELAAMERRSVAITEQATVARKKSFASILESTEGLTTLLKFGGALAIMKLAASEIADSAEKLSEAIKKIRTGERGDDDILVLEFGKAIPIFGRLIEQGERAGRATREIVTGELAANEVYQKKLDIQREYMENLKVEQERRLQIQREERDFAKQYIQSQKERAKALEAEGEAYRRNIEEQRLQARRAGNQRWQDRFGAVGNWLANDSFSAIRGRIAAFNAGREFFKGWFSGGQEKGRESRFAPSPTSASYGSSAAANIIARSTSNNQKRMADAIDELVRLTRNRKPGVVLEKDF